MTMLFCWPNCISHHQSDQMKRLFFNIWQLITAKICQIAEYISQSMFKNSLSIKVIRTTIAKDSKIGPKWRNFGKFGHTGTHHYLCPNSFDAIFQLPIFSPIEVKLVCLLQQKQFWKVFDSTGCWCILRFFLFVTPNLQQMKKWLVSNGGGPVVSRATSHYVGSSSNPAKIYSFS